MAENDENNRLFSSFSANQNAFAMNKGLAEEIFPGVAAEWHCVA